MKILLIDDHKLFSQSIKMILELSENIKKVQLVDNFSTISEIAFNDYDIILIDINLTRWADLGTRDYRQWLF